MCSNTVFLSIFAVGAKRVNNLVTYALKEEHARPERRSGFHPNEGNEQTKRLIRQHIERFPCKDSHYARSEHHIASFSRALLT